MSVCARACMYACVVYVVYERMPVCLRAFCELWCWRGLRALCVCLCALFACMHACVRSRARVCTCAHTSSASRGSHVATASNRFMLDRQYFLKPYTRTWGAERVRQKGQGRERQGGGAPLASHHEPVTTSQSSRASQHEPVTTSQSTQAVHHESASRKCVATATTSLVPTLQQNSKT